ncbi:alpha/beta hydrolase [Yinghuangia seranimata]|uniref:alpha/beta hydrolase n=1 Tax=Yinghuangia seranimata TaxID=408067 RepID=UPI00248AA855|nr:alpha/beta fold hydrolase [Yinghuangia seranimata]MDI2131744.1 alpha/beta fold hydrolase [Yinghuangia seranimata]
MPWLSDGAVDRPASRTAATTQTDLFDHHALLSADGVTLSAVHHADGTGEGGRDLAFVVAHGFTGSWRLPRVGAVVSELRAYGGVVAFDFRGHGASGGSSTVGDREVLDLDAAVRWARELGYRRIVTVGFSMGGSVVVRHAALREDHAPVDAVVAVSAPARWYYRGTPPMRRIHFAIDHPIGRLVTRAVLRTRVSGRRWNPVPEAPKDVVGRIAPTPLLIVHGDRDAYFPVDHPEQLYAAAREPKELWIEPGLGHAENAVGPELVKRIGEWAERASKRRT